MNIVTIDDLKRDANRARNERRKRSKAFPRRFGCAYCARTFRFAEALDQHQIAVHDLDAAS